MNLFIGSFFIVATLTIWHVYDSPVEAFKTVLSL
jgi:hypothetical protein